jgi:hypothetical protein
MNMIDFNLVPYVGADPITFEMSPPAVENIIGPPISVGTNDYGEREEWRDSLIVRYSNRDSRVVEITFRPNARLLYKGVDLFQKEAVISFLSQYDRPFEIVGFVVFLDLGILMTGFHDNDESQKAITVFRKGRMDQFRGQLARL